MEINRDAPEQRARSLITEHQLSEIPQSNNERMMAMMDEMLTRLFPQQLQEGQPDSSSSQQTQQASAQKTEKKYDKLDVDSTTIFAQFQKDAELTSFDWDDQLVAIEKACTLTTFTKLNARRMQLAEPDKQQNLAEIIQITDEMVQQTRSVWVVRNQFHKLQQNQNQPVRNFHSEVVALLSECEFGKGFCDDCQQKDVDFHILEKLVFSTNEEEARKELLKSQK